MDKLITIGCLVLFALVPAVLLYYLFGVLNQAGVEWSGKSVQLGGPVAAFFAVLWFISNMYFKISPPNPLEKQLKSLVGNWIIESDSYESGRKAYSTAVMKVENGSLHIEGGVFREEAIKGEKEGKVIGDWGSEIAVFDGNHLLYLYTLTDRKAVQSTWKGVVRASLSVSEGVPSFVGIWQVFGPIFHEGEIRIRKGS